MPPLSHPFPLLLVVVVVLSFASFCPFVAARKQAHFRPPPECIQTADARYLNSLLSDGGAGYHIVLCPHAQLFLDSHGDPITFTAPDQAIFTAGVPEDQSRATITIAHPKGFYSGELTTAIKADCDRCRGVNIRNIILDGGRNELGGLEGGNALILVGGNAGEQEVRYVDASEARGFAILHASEGSKATCSGVVVSDNVFRSSGDAPIDLMLTSELARLRDGPLPYRGQTRPGHWTDGISIACAQSSVQDNNLLDLSGVAIALRGAPGTQVIQNTISAKDRDMLSAIAVVAHPAFSRSNNQFGGVIVRENKIHAASAMIRVGISTGAAAWATDDVAGDHDIPFGSEIVKNRLSSYTGYFGYGISISDAKGIVVTDNAISASMWGFQTAACYTRPVFPLPAPLLRDSRSVIGKLQPEFRQLHYGFLLCVGPGSPSSDLTISRHQINEEYIEQTATRRRLRAARGANQKEQSQEEQIRQQQNLEARGGGGGGRGSLGERGRQMRNLQRKRMGHGLGSSSTVQSDLHEQAESAGGKQKVLVGSGPNIRRRLLAAEPRRARGGDGSFARKGL